MLLIVLTVANGQDYGSINDCFITSINDRNVRYSMSHRTCHSVIYSNIK